MDRVGGDTQGELSHKKLNLREPVLGEGESWLRQAVSWFSKRVTGRFEVFGLVEHRSVPMNADRTGFRARNGRRRPEASSPAERSHWGS